MNQSNQTKPNLINFFKSNKNKKDNVNTGNKTEDQLNDSKETQPNLLNFFKNKKNKKRRNNKKR